MNTQSAPLPTPEDQATERLATAIESAIGVLQQRLANLTDDHDQDAKWSVSDLIKLLQLRNQLQEERPRTILARWVDDPAVSAQTNIANNNIARER